MVRKGRFNPAPCPEATLELVWRDELLEDLEQLGLRPRRQHDARRTFITCALEDGARKELLRWVTHGPEGDIVDAYTSPSWQVLCQQVALLNYPFPESPPATGEGSGGGGFLWQNYGVSNCSEPLMNLSGGGGNRSRTGGFGPYSGHRLLARFPL
jgi:hypothetical protein